MKRVSKKYRMVLFLRWLGALTLGLTIIPCLFYAVEDWRGAQAWAATKAEWEAKGESFDRAKFVPPPIPDEQNIAALPLFNLEPVPNEGNPNNVSDATLRRAMRDDLPDLDFSHTSVSSTGGLPDLAALRKVVATNYSLAVQGGTPPDSALAQFTAIYPFLSDFLPEAATRPTFRPNYEYLTDPPFARSLGPVTDPIHLAKILSLQAMLAEDEQRAELALQDMQINLTLTTGVGRDPTLVGGLVSLGVFAISRGAIFNGIARHAWSDAQLAALDKMLQTVDFLAGFQFSMRAEVLQGIGSLEFTQHAKRSEVKRVMGDRLGDNPLTSMIVLPWPSGWWDWNKVELASFDLNEVATSNPQAHQCYPKLADRLRLQARQAEEAPDAWAPWKALAVQVAPAMSNALEKFAEGQVSVDETRIACALERYRLAHGVYPATLAALVPASMAEIPHDIMNGEPYHYRLNVDGTFLLYSVGWNETDDGGTVAHLQNSPKSIDNENGDWVWPTAENLR